MTGRQPNPRDVRRLATLEADLKTQREAAEKLVTERNDLAGRLTEVEGKLKAAEDAQADEAKELEALLKLFERLFKARGISAPPDRTPRAFLDALTTFLTEQIARADKAELQGGAFEAQSETASDALKDATQKFRELKERADAQEAEQKTQIAALAADLTKTRAALVDLQKADNALEPLLAENQRLAAQIDATATESAALRATAAAAKADVEAARADTDAAVRAELGKQIEKLTTQQAALQKQLDTAKVQLKEQGKTPIVPAEQVASLLNDLVGQFQTNFSGLQIRDGELALRVGFAAAGDVTGFVVPTADSTPEMRESLQEIRLRFDRDTLIR